MGNQVLDLRQQIMDEGLENTLGLFYSVYRGIVSNNEDPEFLGRIMVEVPGIHDELHEYWAPSRGIFCGAGIGFFAIPNKGDMVWVTFEMGDANLPVWEYGHPFFIDGKTTVPTAARNNGDKPTNYVLQSTSGHRLEFDDKNLLIRFTSKHGDQIEMNDTAISFVVSGGRKVSLGSLNSSKEKAALGDTLKKKLEDLCDQVTAICEACGIIVVPTGVGPSGFPTNATTFTTNIKGQVASIKNSLSEILSKVVELD